MCLILKHQLRALFHFEAVSTIRARCVLVCCWFLFNQRGQAPLPDLFYFLTQVPFDVCATENRTSQEEGLAPALNRSLRESAATH